LKKSDDKIGEAQIIAHIKTYRPEEFIDEFVVLCEKYGDKDYKITRSPFKIAVSVDKKDDYFMF